MSDANSPSLSWRPATFYPDPAIHALDPRFEKYWLKLSAVERLARGLRWAEGPVWVGDGRYLLCSDIPNQRILKWEEETGAVSIYRKPSNFANGNTRDRQGRLITCEHGGRRVTRTAIDGPHTVLMDSFNGKPPRRTAQTPPTGASTRRRVGARGWACAATSTEISGGGGEGATPSSTPSGCSPPTAPRSPASGSPGAAPLSASAD